MDVLEEGTYDRSAFAEELDHADPNLTVGTSLWFENDRVRVWEVRLDPATRCPFHAHTRPYFWTCVGAGVGRQRSGDGSMRVLRYTEGDTHFSEHTDADPLMHDLENVGDTVLRFVTVELLD